MDSQPPTGNQPQRRRLINPRLINAGVALIALAIALGFVHQHIRFPTHIFSGDWLQMQFYWEAPRQEILRFGQIPLWNPYYCGGNLLMGHPHSQFVTPFFLVALLFGTSIGYRVAVVGHLLLGIWGMNRLGKLLGMSASSRALISLAFPFTGFFAWHIVGGHFWVLGFQLLPWLYEAYLRALGPAAGLPESPRRWGWIFAGAVFLAWMVFHSGMYSVPFSLLALGLDALLRSATNRTSSTRLRPLIVSAAIGFLGFLLSGPKSFPLLEFLRDHHRTFSFSDDALLLEDLQRMFFARSTEWKWDKADGRLLYKWWGEYANDIGYPLIPLAMLGFLAHFRRYWVFSALSALFLLCMLGEHSQWSLYTLLRTLPVFKGLHVPARFTVMFTFFLALGAGFGLDALQSWLRPHFGPRAALIIAWALLLLTFVEPYVHHIRVNALNGHIKHNPVAPAAIFHQRKGSPKWMYRYPIQNSGSLACYELARLPQTSALRTGDRPEAYPQQQVMGEVFLKKWTPNLLELEVMAWAPTRVLINQNYHSGWRVHGEAEVRNHKGLLALDVPPGPHDLTLRYLPASFVLGSLASGGVLAVALLQLLLIFLRKRRVGGKVRADPFAASHPNHRRES